MEKLVGEGNIDWFKDLFSTLDKDGSGDLDLSEVELAIQTTADGKADPVYLLSITDTDNSGTLNLTEFMFLFLIAQEPMDEIKDLVKIYNKYKTQNKGLDHDQTHCALNEYSIMTQSTKVAKDGVFNSFFITVDVDGDNYLNTPEFLIFYLSISGKLSN